MNPYWPNLEIIVIKLRAPHLGIQQLREVGSAGRGDCVPQHEQPVTDVQHPELGAEGCHEESDDDEADGEDEDGGIPPGHVTTHKGDHHHLQGESIKTRIE